MAIEQKQISKKNASNLRERKTAGKKEVEKLQEEKKPKEEKKEKREKVKSKERLKMIEERQEKRKLRKQRREDKKKYKKLPPESRKPISDKFLKLCAKHYIISSITFMSTIFMFTLYLMVEIQDERHPSNHPNVTDYVRAMNVCTPDTKILFMANSQLYQT